MSVVFPVPAACTQHDHHGPASSLHSTAGSAPTSHARRVQLVEYLAMSLVLHAVLALWAAVTSPSSTMRAPDADAPSDELTFTIASVLTRGEIEEPLEVASLVPHEVAVQETAPPPVEPEPTGEAEPTTMVPSIAPPETRVAEVVAPPPLAPRSVERVEEPPLAAASPPPAEDPIAEKETEEETVASADAVPGTEDEPALPAEATFVAPAPPESGTPEGESEDALADAPQEALAQEPQTATTSELEPAPGPETGIERGVPPEPELDLPTAPRPVPGPGPGPVASEAPPAKTPPQPVRAAEPEPAKPVAKPAAKPVPTNEPTGRTLESCRRDVALMARARAELAEGSRKGLTTVLLAAPEDQLEIARYFGEELVLVPRTALAAGVPPRYYRLAAGSHGVETVASAPPLEGHRQYRDLFDYEYGRLPAALRDLRRSVPAREDVYLFAALLSPAEWAMVIARREEALARAGRDISTVRQFVLRYTRGSGGSFDLSVVEIVFTDGSRVRSGDTERGSR